MLLADSVYHVGVDKDSDKSKDELKLSDDLADHRKKVFWAMLIPTSDGGVFSPQDFVRLKEIANDIHLSRVMSLYTTIDEETPQTAISNDQLDRIIGATEARLNLENFKEIRQLDSEGEQLIGWLTKALADPLLQRFVLSSRANTSWQSSAGIHGSG